MAFVIPFPAQGSVGGSMEIKNDVSTKTEIVTGIIPKVTPLLTEEQFSNVSTTDHVQIADVSAQRQKTHDIAKANEAIASLVKVTDDVKKLSDLVTSVSGIADLAQKESTTKPQREILNRESQQLSTVIITLAAELRAAKIVTVPDEMAQKELERNLAEALDVFLPEPPHGPADLNVSTKEAILQTRSIVSRTQAQIDKLRDALKAELEKTVESVKSRRVNEPEKDAITEADQAFKTSQTLREEIGNSPSSAQSAFASQNVVQSSALFK